MTKKARFIRNNELLSHAQKDQVISFFSKHPNYEKYIDWNKKLIKFDEYKKVIRLADNSKNNRKRKKKKNPAEYFKGKNYKIIGQTNDFLIVLPLNRKAFVFFNSFQCGGEGAVWCTGNKFDAASWKKYYTDNKTMFYFVYFIKKNIFLGKKILIEYNVRDDIINLWLQSGNCVDFDLFGYLIRQYYNICKEEPDDNQLFLEFDNVIIDTKKITEKSFLLQLVKKAYEKD